MKLTNIASGRMKRQRKKWEDIVFINEGAGMKGQFVH
jgi:hypothetical protein